MGRVARLDQPDDQPFEHMEQRQEHLARVLLLVAAARRLRHSEIQIATLSGGAAASQERPRLGEGNNSRTAPACDEKSAATSCGVPPLGMGPRGRLFARDTAANETLGDIAAGNIKVSEHAADLAGEIQSRNRLPENVKRL